MKTSAARILLGSLSLLLFLPCLSYAEDLSDNLIFDGGVEQWKEIGPDGTAGSWWNHLTVGNKPELTHDAKGNVLKPEIFSQCQGTKTMKPETQEVHGGKTALRLNGAFYLRQSSPDAYKTQDGNVYLIRYWARGEGKTEMYITVYGEGQAQTIETKGSPSKENWSLIEKRFQVTGRAPTSIYPYLSASAEMLIDDISMARVLPKGERQLVPIASDCQERVAFAAEMDGICTLDGKFDEPAWGKAVAFGGFRFAEDQTLLAAAQPSFRVLVDASNLYFGVEIPLPNARQLRDDLKNQPLLDGAGKPRPLTDTYTSRDSIELFLQAPGRSRYLQLVASLDGYRYDGAGADGSWNGVWECAVSAGDDRWYLEVKVPAQDLGIERIAPAEGWRLNLCCNQKSGCSTWAAVGPAFHNPTAFGKLIAQDFAPWREQQPAVRTRMRAEILAAAGTRASLYTDRLALIDASVVTSAGGNDQTRDWEGITRLYSQMDFIGYAYRCVAEEVRYRGLFQ